jgi:CopG antitoxin of type II toxin-antitoxin system
VDTKTKKGRDPLPEHFGNAEEAAEFWDAHDSTDYEEYMSEADCRVSVKRRAYMISLDGELYRKLRAIAKDRG